MEGGEEGAEEQGPGEGGAGGEGKEEEEGEEEHNTNHHTAKATAPTATLCTPAPDTPAMLRLCTVTSTMSGPRGGRLVSAVAGRMDSQGRSHAEVRGNAGRLRCLAVSSELR